MLLLVDKSVYLTHNHNHLCIRIDFDIILNPTYKIYILQNLQK